MGKRRRRRSRSSSGFWTQQYGGMPAWGLVAAVAFLALAAAVAIPAIASQPTADPNRNATPRTTFSFGSATQAPVAEERLQPGEALDRMDDDARPFTISVIGDSTGAIEDNWVRQTATWLSEEYDRPVELHQWSVRQEPNGYLDVETIGSGDAAPIVIWNGSAEGMNIDYSLDNWDDMVPVDPAAVDLAFINHGHNVAADSLRTEGARLAKRITSRMPEAALVVIGQNPQTDEGGTLGPAQEANVRDWMTWAEAQGYATVNVLDAFLDYGDYSELLLGAVHPNAEGFTLWTDQVQVALAR